MSDRCDPNRDIRITKHYTDEDGFSVWPGDTFDALNGEAPYEGGTEVKVAGEYIWVPRDIFEVIER